MLKFIFVLGFLGAFEYHVCCLETQTEDWRKQGFYRPQRSYPSQNDNSYQASQNQYSISQTSFRSNGQSSGANNQNVGNQNSFLNNQNSQTQSNFGSYNQPQASFGFANQKKESPRSEIPFGAYQNAQSNGFGRKDQTGNSQQETQGTFGSRFGQNTFASSFNQNPGFNNGQNSFTNSQSQYTQKQSFESSIQGTQNYFRNSSQNSFGNQNQNTFPLQNATSSFSNFGSNSFTKNFKAPDYLPPARFKAPEYLPPDPRTTIPPYISKTTTRRPFYTTTTRQPITTTKRPFFTTTTTRLNLFTTTTTKRPLRPPPVFLPAQAMNVLPEPEDDGDEIIPVTSNTPSTTTTTTPTTTTRKSPYPAPALAMRVPPETEDDDTEPNVRNTTAQVAPARAMNVPPEPEDDGDEIIPVTRTTTSTTPSTTTTTTPTTTTSTTTTTTTTPSTTTSTTPSTTTTTTTTTPSTTTSTTPPTTTTTTTPSTTITTPSTTTTITPPTTMTTTAPSTTTTPSTTTSTTPPTTPTTTTPSTTTTTTTTTPDPNRNLLEDDPTTTPTVTTSNTSTTTTTCTTITTCTTTYKAPECLPSKDTEPVPPAPALANPVPPEPECDPLDPLDPYNLLPLNIEIRTFDPCRPEPTTTTIKPLLRGPSYLPPDPKVRVERSSNITLKLEDLDGIYRPVWYAGIYRKTTNPYLPICGGSIIREDVVISAAHCFWDDAVGKQPASLFAVAARKLYKPWKETMDKKAQKSDVLDIKIPPRFLGAKTSFQEDLAILKLATPFTYNRGLRPICVDFDDDFDRQQMKAGHLGTIAGWGYTDAAGTPTQRLLWLELPYVEIEKCIRDSEDSFLKYITCDKVCAGENDTGKALCRGDSGGGLAFWSGAPRHATPYLRGVASTAPSRRNAECNVFAYASFTHLRAHRTFLRDHVPDIENCRFWE